MVNRSANKKALRHSRNLRECAKWQGRTDFTLCKIQAVHIIVEKEDWAEIKVIITFEDEYRAYQDTLAAAVRILRPDAEVVTTEPEKLNAVAKRFGPDIVIGSRFKDADLDSVLAWIELSLDFAELTKVYVNGKYSEMVNPTLDKLLGILEEVAMITQKSSL